MFFEGEETPADKGSPFCYGRRSGGMKCLWHDGVFFSSEKCVGMLSASVFSACRKHEPMREGLFMFRRSFLAGCAFLWLFSCSPAVGAHVTLLVPSQPSIECPPAEAGQEKEKSPVRGEKGVTAPPAGSLEPAVPVEGGAVSIDKELDLLITLMRPDDHGCLDMEMPQLMSILRFDDHSPVEQGQLMGERRDLLGDLEEIRYLDSRAWGVNVAISKPGLYHFMIETRPRWRESRQRYEQDFVKTTVPVYGESRGWEIPCGLRLEVVPRTRPFGLTAPCLFSAQIRWQGAPLSGAQVRMYRINTDKTTPALPTPWHASLEARTDADGNAAFVLNRSGWWCCVAETDGEPLKGPDGTPKPLRFGGVFWLYVDDVVTAATTEKKR